MQCETFVVKRILGFCIGEGAEGPKVEILKFCIGEGAEGPKVKILKFCVWGWVVSPQGRAIPVGCLGGSRSTPGVGKSVAPITYERRRANGHMVALCLWGMCVLCAECVCLVCLVCRVSVFCGDNATTWEKVDLTLSFWAFSLYTRAIYIDFFFFFFF